MLPKVEWSKEYASGTYQGAKDAQQPYRYMVIAGLLHNRASVLDVACGNALLRGYLTCNYTGIDGCSEVIRMCGDVWGETFICADAVTWTTDYRFDAIVLNEMLYYIEDQPAFLAKYSKLLTSTGIIIVSIFDKPTRLFERKTNRIALGNALAFAGDKLQCRLEISENGKKRTLLVIGHC